MKFLSPLMYVGGFIIIKNKVTVMGGMQPVFKKSTTESSSTKTKTNWSRRQYRPADWSI